MANYKDKNQTNQIKEKRALRLLGCAVPSFKMIARFLSFTDFSTAREGKHSTNGFEAIEMAAISLSMSLFLIERRCLANL